MVLKTGNSKQIITRAPDQRLWRCELVAVKAFFTSSELILMQFIKLIWINISRAHTSTGHSIATTIALNNTLAAHRNVD